MTPFQLFRETPVRLRALPTLWKVLLCSALSTTLAVVLMAWQAARFCTEHHQERAVPVAAWPIKWPTTLEIRVRMETGCKALATMRETHTGLYAPVTP